MANSKVEGLKLLVAEDSEGTLMMVRSLLEQRGYCIVEATDGEQAIEVARRERPDVILMDLFMPKMDGFTAARRIREDPQMQDVLIVALSAHMESQYRAQAQAAGINAFVTKPIDVDFLDDLLCDLVESK